MFALILDVVVYGGVPATLIVWRMRVLLRREAIGYAELQDYYKSIGEKR